jgi:hypothetical protein
VKYAGRRGAAKIIESIQQGQLRTLTSLGDAAAYRALADLIVAGIAGTPSTSNSRQPSR